MIKIAPLLSTQSVWKEVGATTPPLTRERSRDWQDGAAP